MVRSITAVIGSYLLSIVLVLASDPLLRQIFPGEFDKGHVPSNPPLLASTAIFIAVSILCAWLCARFAPPRKERHVLAFFLLGEVLGVASVIPNWSSGWPHWYWLSWLLSWPVSCWLGLALARRSAAKSA
ncbi:MAG: hypothetical protein JSS29_10910 [Proteobacteria bacterium]|nr:hypothetical protein [Pseudomonadota bacterium]